MELESAKLEDMVAPEETVTAMMIPLSIEAPTPTATPNITDDTSIVSPITDGDKEEPLPDDTIDTKTEISMDDKGFEGDEEDAGELGEDNTTILSNPEGDLDPDPDAFDTEADLDDVDGGEPVKFVIEPQELECQFFGSFYNEKQLREPVMDLVTFATPCKVSEIRIIPLGATVEMLDGVAMLGSTNPTNFDLEFYYEDLTDPSHSSFKEITKFTYDHKLSIHFSCGSDDTPIITNKLLVRGVYNSITLAVIGHEVKDLPVREVTGPIGEGWRAGEGGVYSDGESESGSGNGGDSELEYAHSSSEEGGEEEQESYEVGNEEEEEEYWDRTDEEEEESYSSDFSDEYEEEVDPDQEREEAHHDFPEGEEEVPESHLEYQQGEAEIEDTHYDYQEGEVEADSHHDCEQGEEPTTEEDRPYDYENQEETDQYDYELGEEATGHEEREEDTGTGHYDYDSEEADDDVEMKDAFDTSLEDEVDFQEDSPSPPRDEHQNTLNQSPPPSWGQEGEIQGEVRVEPSQETDDGKSSQWNVEGREERAESVISEDSFAEDDGSTMEIDKEYHPGSAESFPIDTQAEIDTPTDTEEPTLVTEEEKELERPVAQSPPRPPVSQTRLFQPHLDMEDISDISSGEDLGVAESDGEDEPVRKSAVGVPKSPSMDSSPAVKLGSRTTSEVVRAEALSEHEFEDDFEDDLEVISDEEIRDESEPEDIHIGDFDENFPDVYGRPYDQESFQLYRPQNHRVELYPKTFLRNDNPLKEKLTVALKTYTPATFKVDMVESWVETMEQVLPILTPYLRNHILLVKSQATKESVVFWIQKAFQLEPTTSPESVTRSLRQLKVGLKLVFLLCEFDPHLSRTVSQLVLDAQSTTVQEKVTETLLTSRIPAVQCLCAKALEATLNTKIGFESFVAKKGDGPSIFEEMLSSLMDMKLNTLVYGSIGPVFRTVSLIPALLELGDDGGDSSGLDQVLSNLRTILDSIEDIERGTYTMKRTSSVAVHNVISRHLPGYDGRVSFVKILQETSFLDSCSKLLRRTTPEGKAHYALIYLLVRIFESLLHWEVGILYLAQEFPLELLQGLSRTELPNSPGQRFATYFSQCVTVLKCVDLSTKKVEEMSPMEAEGVIDSLQETYMLLSYESGRKAIKHVFTTGDFITPLLDSVKFAETSKVEGDKIQDLEKVAIGGYSVEILAHVIRNGDNFQFLSVHGDEICRLYESLREDFEGYGKLSEVISFMRPTRVGVNLRLEGVGELCEQLKRGAEDVLLKSKENFGFPPEMVTHLRILDNLAISGSGRNSFDFVSGGVGIERTRTGDSIRHKLVCVSMNSTDILTTLALILTKLTVEFRQPAVHAHTFLFAKGEALTALILPTVRIIRKLLTEMILIRNTSFRDLSLVPTLLETYALVDAFPETSMAVGSVAKIKVHVIAALQTYTIPVMKVGETSEEELTNSIWTRMMMELISFTMSSPCNFIPGMRILSELQPLKLPLMSSKELSEGTKAHLISLRKLWSAFLHGVTTPLQEMIGILCESTNRELLVLVKRVCFQIGDLSAASCLVVCRGILEQILNSIETDLDENSTGSQQGSGGTRSNSVTAWVEGSHDRRHIQGSPRTARLLGFLNSLTRKSGILKAGVLQVIKGSSKLDEKFSEFLTLLGSILTSRTHSGQEPNKPSVSQTKSQGHVMSIFHTLCNPRVNMFWNDGDEVLVDGEYLKGNSLPPKDAMSLICSSLLTFLAGQEDVTGNVAVIRKIFYALNILCETEYGFYHLRVALSKNSGVIHELILKLRTTELEHLDIVGVMESLEVIDGVLSFLRNLITPQQIQGKRVNGIESRKTILSKLEFRRLLTWTSPEKMLNHPLLQLCNYFQLFITREQSQGSGDGNEEQEYVKTYIGDVKEKLDNVLTFLNQPGGEGQESLTEVVLSPPDSLQDQFNSRPVVVRCELSDSSQRLDYLSQIGHGGGDMDFEFSMEDLIVRDLLATVKECSKEAETEFPFELERFCNLKRPEENGTPPVKTKSQEELTYGDLHGRGSQNVSQRSTTSTLSSSGGKPSFLREGNAGRHGFGRGLLSNRPNFDPFRSRPPNTSRPPSLHVDDFVAMGSQGSTGSTRAHSTGNNGGYRGRGRGGPNLLPLGRSSFTSPPDKGGRGYRSSQGTPYYASRSDDTSLGRGRTQQRGRGYSSGGGGGDRWPNPLGGNEGSQGSNYGRHHQEDSYGERRSFGGGGRGSFRDQRGRSTTPGGGDGSSSQQQRWRNNPDKFNR